MPGPEGLAPAEVLYRAGDYAAAAALLESLRGRTQPPQAARLLGLCRLRQGAVQDALALLADARAREPGDPWSALHHGIALQAAGRHAEAATLFRTAAEALPGEAAPLLNLSAALLALGDAPGAIRAARKGRLRGGNTPEGNYTLGLAYLAGGFLDRAADAFQAATRIAPGFADAWVNLGVARYRAGRIEPARQAMLAALKADPAKQSARTNLATFLRLTGHAEEAEAMLHGLLKAHPEAAATRVNLAADLLRDGSAAEALALLDREPPADDAALAQHWRLQQALALIRLRRRAEARALLDALGPVPDALAPLVEWRRALLALADGAKAAATQHAARMEAGLEAALAMLPEHRIMGYYELAKFWSGLRMPDLAFAHWTKGHRLLAKFQPFSREAHAAFVDATIEAFDAPCLGPGRAAGNDDPAPVFVVGMPRSGTTLIEQILHAHPEAYGAGERAALGEAFQRLGGEYETAAAVRRVAALEPSSLDAHARRYLATLHALAPSARRIVDKMPGNARYLGLAARMLPGARFIACERDPRDIGLSIYTFRFFGLHPYAHDLSDLGWYIGQHRRLMAHWRRVLPGRVLTVRLQDWVEDFSATLRRVLAFLDLPYDPACERYYEAEREVRTVSRHQVRQPINARGIGRWREYERHLSPLIDALREYGALDE